MNSRNFFQKYLVDIAGILMPEQGLTDLDIAGDKHSAFISIKLDNKPVFGCAFDLNDERAKSLEKCTNSFLKALK